MLRKDCVHVCKAVLEFFPEEKSLSHWESWSKLMLKLGSEFLTPDTFDDTIQQENTGRDIRWKEAVL